MKSVFLDCAFVNPGDVSWKPISDLCDCEFYRSTAPEEMEDRLEGVEAIFMDSCPVTREIMESHPDLKFIGIAATGFNHVDLEAAKENNIAVTNVPAYSTEAVAQHAISLLLAVTNKVATFNKRVEEGQWDAGMTDVETMIPVVLLAGKSIGIVGYGNIGKQVARIAEALGMTVNVYSKDKEAAMKSDVVSFHCPLTPENTGMVNEEFISQMKDGAILINTARGGLLDEAAVAEALKSGKLSGAGVDVLAQEPPSENNPLIGLENCLVTPHIAFTPVETRQRVVDICGENLKSFLDGGSLNRLV